MWADFVKQRTLLEEREDTISKLHARLSVLEEGAKRGPVNSISHPVRELPSNHFCLQLCNPHSLSSVSFLTFFVTIDGSER